MSLKISQRIKQQLQKRAFVAETVAEEIRLWDQQGCTVEGMLTKPGVVVISAADATELHEFFSVKSYRELRQAVTLFVKQLNLPSPVHFWVNKRTDTGFFVTLCSIDTTVREQLTNRFKRGALLLPEQLLLQASDHEACEVRLSEKNSRRYVLDKNYQLKVNKGQSTLAALMSTSAELPKLNAEELIACIAELPASMYLLGTVHWLSSEADEQKGAATARLLGVGSALVALYLLLSSGFLAWQEHQLKSDFDTSRTKLREAIAIENKVASRVDELKALTTPLVQYRSKLLVFDALSKVKEKVLLHNVSVNSETIEMRGATTNATNMYETLRVHKGIANAEFMSPVRQSRGAEQFSLRLEVEQP